MMFFHWNLFLVVGELGRSPISAPHTRNTFITSSPRWLITFTAIRPDARPAKGHEVSVFRISQVSLLMPAFTVVRSLVGIVGAEEVGVADGKALLIRLLDAGGLEVVADHHSSQNLIYQFGGSGRHSGSSISTPSEIFFRHNLREFSGILIAITRFVSRSISRHKSLCQRTLFGAQARQSE